MNLGITGRWATVCASVDGSGRACAEALAAEGVNIVVNGCVPEEAQEAAAAIAAAHGVEVRAVAADPATEAGRGRLLSACPGPDILVTCAPRREPAALPAGADGLNAALRTHYLEQEYWAPVALVQAVMDGMRGRRFGRIVNITVAETPVQRLLTAFPSGGRSGVTAVMQGLAAHVTADNVTINQLVTGHSAAAAGAGVADSRAAAVGATCAILCSALAGSISGMDFRANGDHTRLKLVS